MSEDDEEKGGSERKERVLHTRVPAVLERELKRLADSWRVPVSNVVRAILEDAVTTADTVGRKAETEIRGLRERIARKTDAEPHDAAPPGAPEGDAPPLEGIVGYQALLLARDEKCTLCGAALPAGRKAWLGIRETRGPRVILGKECLPATVKEEEP